jgi:flagellar motor switch protein FliN/FliY
MEAANNPGTGVTPQAFKAPAFENVGTDSSAAAETRPNIDVILDVPVTLSLEVGRAQMSVGHLLRLGPGSIVELDRGAGEPLDVLVNGALVARGEIVIVNDRFGIRLTDVLPVTRKTGLPA